MKKIDELESNTLWNIKGGAVIAIVACHCCHVVEHPCELNHVMVQFFSYWIGYGVPVFYFIAGYLFQTDERGVHYFFLKKVKSIIVPWIFTGTLVWLYIFLRKGGMDWYHFLFMKKSYLYFLNDLLVFYLIFYYVKKHNKMSSVFTCILIAGIVIVEITKVNIVSLLENAFGCAIPLSNMLIFYIGIVFREKEIFRFFSELKWSSLIFVFIIWRFMQINVWKSSGGLILDLLTTMCLIVSMYSFCRWLAMKEVKWSVILGKYSFSIYLLHMPAAGVVANILNRSEWFAILTLWRPVIVIGITLVMIKVYEKLVGGKGEMLNLIGVR